jgi:hypothetical protein
VTFTQNEGFSNITFVVWQFWGRAAEASLTEKSRALFLFQFETWESAPGCTLGADWVVFLLYYFEQAAQYPPISNRDTTMRNRQSFSTCPFSFSKMSLTNSMILPQRRHAMWMWSRFSLRS